MWYKVKELESKGFNKSQISRELGLARALVCLMWFLFLIQNSNSKFQNSNMNTPESYGKKDCHEDTKVHKGLQKGQCLCATWCLSA